MNDNLASLVKMINEKVREASPKHPRRLGTFVIMPDAQGRADFFRDWAAKESMQHVNLCLGAPTPRYEISPVAELTVVIYNPDRPGRQTVQANFALHEGELDVAHRNAILAALSKALPK